MKWRPISISFCSCEIESHTVFSCPEPLHLGATRPFLLVVPPKPGKATRPFEKALNSVCHLVPGLGAPSPAAFEQHLSFSPFFLRAGGCEKESNRWGGSKKKGDFGGRVWSK